MWQDFKAGAIPGLIGTIGVLGIFLFIVLLDFLFGDVVFFAIIVAAIFVMFSVLIGQDRRNNG